jgi:hypothetical protein
MASINWQAIIAISSGILVILKLIQLFSRFFSRWIERKRQLHSEIRERVYKPLRSALDKLTSKLEHFELGSLFEKEQPWPWERLRKDVAHLENKMGRMLDKIEEFTKEYDEYCKIHGWHLEKLNEIITSSIKLVREDFSESPYELKFRMGRARRVHEITLYSLLFSGKDLKGVIREFREKEPESSMNEQEIGKVMGTQRGIQFSQEEFERIDACVKECVEKDEKLRLLRDKTRSLFHRANRLKQELDKEIKKW